MGNEQKGLWWRFWVWAYLQGHLSRRVGLLILGSPRKIKMRFRFFLVHLKHPIKSFIINPILDKAIWADIKEKRK